MLLLLFSVFQHKYLRFYVIGFSAHAKKKAFFIYKNIYLLTSEWAVFFHFKFK